MTDYQQIYKTQSDLYDRMVACEDYEGNLLRAIQKIVPLTGASVVELGAGTGRVTELLLPFVDHIIAFDQAEAMLTVAAAKFQGCGCDNFTLAVAENRHLPLVGETAVFAIAGWSLAHSVGWYPNSWQTKISQMLTEMQRMIQPGGTIVLLETLGTGRETPKPPAPHLEAYYHWLETVHGYERTWIRTDYQFSSPEEGASLTRFFFGDGMADHILAEQLTILPECTGIWWKHF
ncbi:MAG: methyltransferase domain-containing protein [Chloroflexi bacterium]|nr:MAG: methyltransferase domain-containing protein [Chloroflexota bacterium]